MKNYIENRELILSSFSENRKNVKQLFLSILNGGFKDIYSEHKQTNNYLKLFEQEIIRIQKFFYINDKRYLDIDYNYKGKNLSRIILDIENQILQIMINYFISKNVNILTLEYDGLKIYTDKYSKHFSINELELNIYKNIGINIKLAFKNIEDKFPEFGIRCNTDHFKSHINCYYIFICGCIMYMICMFNLCIYELYACIMYIKLYIMVYMGHGCI